MPGTTFDIDVIAAGRGKTFVFHDGATIYARGEPGDSAFIVVRGGVRLGNSVPIDVLRAGEIFGEMALIDDAPRSTAAVAVGPTEVMAIDRPLFDVLLQDDPDFALVIMRLLARRLRAAISALDRAMGRPRPELRVIAGG
ncbi:MAG TPA: cyclic nucleotide-binding domain-containing protein [Bauldia sp.]|nr:cyclic nucleotide-binding domain-containing protein [Bauldia sp.]